jgi:hypothetical protein
MRRRLLVAAAALSLALACAGLLALVLIPRGTRIDRQHFEALREGMTRAEAERVLGGPPRNECREPVDVWVRRGGGLQSAEVAPGGLAVRVFPNADLAGGGQEAVWVGEAGLIAARFGDDGRLREKHYSAVQGARRPTVKDVLSRLLRR